jgi:hypothetical protein
MPLCPDHPDTTSGKDLNGVWVTARSVEYGDKCRRPKAFDTTKTRLVSTRVVGEDERLAPIRLFSQNPTGAVLRRTRQDRLTPDAGRR